MKKKNGKRKVSWRSDQYYAEGGIDTEKFGRVETEDLNWKIAKFSIPNEAQIDHLRLSFLNDHCCGPGGPDGGDRNLFIS